MLAAKANDMFNALPSKVKEFAKKTRPYIATAALVMVTAAYLSTPGYAAADDGHWNPKAGGNGRGNAYGHYIGQHNGWPNQPPPSPY